MKVVVVGGGIAGLRVAKKLGATLITDQSEFVFLPRIPELFNKKDVKASKPVFKAHNHIIKGRASKIDPDRKVVHLDKKKIPYDILVMATGARASTKVPGARANTVRFYNKQDVKKIKEKLPVEEIIIIGAGPTGVELAMELADKKHVTLLQREGHILPMFPESAREYALGKLDDAGVDIRTQQQVKEITSDEVISEHEARRADLVIWCAGVEANTVPGLPFHRGYVVNEYLQVPGYEDVYAIGDCAETGAPLSAQAALQEAELCVKNIRRQMKGKKLKEYKYSSKGQIILLGSDAYIASLISVRGRLAARIRDLYYNWQFSRY